MEDFRAADAPSHEAITGSFHHWDDIDVHFRGTTTTTGGHGFCGIERKRLLALLQERGRELGVAPPLPARGRGRCGLRRRRPHRRRRRREQPDAQASRATFEPDIDTRECRYIWLGTTKPFPAFTFAFEETEHGWFQVHAYQFSKTLSTVIVETREETWRAHGLDACQPRPVDRVLHEAVREVPRWPRAHEQCRAPARLGLAQFPARAVQALAPRQRVLIGDAAHTAHFSIGSGTKLAMEDAIALVARTAGSPDIPAALAAYQAGALDRGAEAAERGAQPHALVRERRRATRRWSPGSSPTAC